MEMPSHRYRITVTPVEDDGLPCNGRCTIEFEHRDSDNWTRLLESARRVQGPCGDERTALTIGLRLLNGVAARHPDNAALGALSAELDRFARTLTSP
ncbi:DUF3861 domain-containing protein [Pseudoxanthomonas kalamensis DSM 18571]|uniref:DUF3861 family protein n=1 Tax=Pseudoxanthomonas kalamensis TaxID=289483 RepID=UPI001390E2D8|nr:DUF3861 family protein [Pseudoxanthomonas kalamensis]KAF1711517.1 DUF3861 domain-containing protein [Pseudoxanthomonas kalamensis DSM 18571]